MNVELASASTAHHGPLLHKAVPACARSARRTASPAAPGWAAGHQERRARSLSCAASTSDSFQERAAELASSAQRKLQDFVREQQLENKARKAARAAQDNLSNTMGSLQASARRTYLRLDSEYQLQDRAAKAAKRLDETVNDIDQQYSLRRRLRVFSEDVRRRLPGWQRKLTAFSQTVPGKVSFVLGFWLLLSSGLFWRILNVFWLLWWLSVPLTLIAASVNNSKERTAQAEAQQAAQQAAQNPFGDLYSRMARGATGAYKRSSTGVNQDGPVIDAEWTSIDEGDRRR